MTNNWVIHREHISFFTGDNDNIEGIGLNFWRTAVGYLSKKEISINLNTNISEEEVIKSINFLFNSVHVPRKRRNYFKNYRFSTIYHGKTLHLVFTNMKEINCNNCRVNFLDNNSIRIHLFFDVFNIFIIEKFAHKIYTINFFHISKN